MDNRVLYFHKANDYTGSTNALANVIGNNPAEIVTITPGERGIFSDMPNVKLLYVPYPKYKNRTIPVFTFLISYLWRIILTFKSCNKYDTFYINTITPFYAALIGRMFKKKIIYHIHEKIIDPSLVYRIAERVFLKTPSETIYVSYYLKSCYPQKRGLYSIRYNKLSDSFLQKVSVRSIKDRPLKNVLMVSSLSKEKGVDSFISIASELPQYSFTLVLSTSKEVIENSFHNIGPNLTIYPQQKELSKFYKNADLLLNLTKPSICIETFGLTILEAMVYGVPAIAPNVGGPKELIVDDYNGYLVDVENKQSVVDAIKKAMTPSKYESLMNNSINRYKELYEKGFGTSINL